MSDEKKEPQGSESSASSWRQALLVGGLALSLPTMLFGPPLVGSWLDSAFGTKPWFTLSLLVVGLISAAYNVYIILKRVKVI